MLARVAHVRIGASDEQLLALWELRDGALALRRVATTPMLPRAALGLTVVLDLRGDGQLLLLYATADGRGALTERGDAVVDVPALHLATP